MTKKTIISKLKEQITKLDGCARMIESLIDDVEIEMQELKEKNKK